MIISVPSSKNFSQSSLVSSLHSTPSSSAQLPLDFICSFTVLSLMSLGFRGSDEVDSGLFDPDLSRIPESSLDESRSQSSLSETTSTSISSASNSPPSSSSSSDFIVVSDNLSENYFVSFKIFTIFYINTLFKQKMKT